MSQKDDIQLIPQPQQRSPNKMVPQFYNQKQQHHYVENQRKSETNYKFNGKIANSLHSTQTSKIILPSLRKESKLNVFGRYSCTQSELTFQKNQQKVKNCQIKFKKLTQTDVFQCKNCLESCQNKCKICNDQKQLKGNNNLIKFFQYILEFKLGKVDQFNNQTKNINKYAPNQHCNLFFSSSAFLNSQKDSIDSTEYNLRNSVNPNYLTRNSECSQKQINQLQIHHMYGCNQCDMDPIIGNRYHCELCQDYDMCQCCYSKLNHPHQLKKIQFKKKPNNLDKFSNLLKSTNNGFLSSSIQKNCLSFRNSFNSKIYKSSIR